MTAPSQRWAVARLGTAQTLAWASSYYLPAMLAVPMARDLGVATPTVFAAFSLALIVSALLGPLAGRAIDQHGGRPVLVGTNVLFAAALASMALAQGPVGLFAAWVLMGVAMGSGLYEAAFATLVRLYGQGARGAITGITLIAGFASTVGWPLSAWMEVQWGWRGACLGWAALHILWGVPLNGWLPRAQPPAQHDAPDTALQAASTPESASTANSSTTPQPGTPATTPPPNTLRSTVLLSFVFAVTWFTSTAMAAHLPRLLQASGTSLQAAVAIAALVGPAQVVARLLEFGLLRRVHPLLSAQLAAAAHPVGAAILMVVGGPAAAVFTVLHGAGNGILTIAKGTLPLVLFGPSGYGARQGLMMVPARVAQAFAPVLFGMLLDGVGAAAVWLTALLGAAALGALRALRPASTPHS
ncbi:MAG: MFS transporter [Gammaproteobacteria bacterium]|nr:MFS transporter [Gammaproteobacteria bacterium]MBU1507212.1 MFS transporter [Gammaproteobacteria bacterium]MBU2121264.1 MFS transporter [Gammaproteobacteria bacterium]MBU2171027.1 MFS transporter [Gammaproteobacteria bacterium]MBU2201661.1 MFS transporter [Gammaproteobacteria bacterium]